jgi:hypothetical protein
MTTTFKQTQQIGKQGSLINQMIGNNSTIPIIGKGATMLHYSDRTPYEVIEVSEDGKSCVIEEYNTKCDISKPREMGHQNWVLDGLNGNRKKLVWRNNSWRQVCETIELTDEACKWIDDNRQQWNEETSQCPNKYFDENANLREIEGFSRKKKTFGKVSIIFGKAEKYHDWSF